MSVPTVPRLGQILLGLGSRLIARVARAQRSGSPGHEGACAERPGSHAGRGALKDL